MTARTLRTDEYFLLTADDGQRLLRLERSPTPFATTAAIEQAFDGLEQAAAGIPADWKLLIDVRHGPMRNDPEFERILARARLRVFSRFARMATLAQSAIGRLQIQRHAREDGKSAPTLFEDEGAAIAWLNGG